jgi:hypothetical protein
VGLNTAVSITVRVDQSHLYRVCWPLLLTIRDFYSFFLEEVTEGGGDTMSTFAES